MQPQSEIIPQDIKAEQAVLGSMLIAPAVAVAIAGQLKASDFYRWEHGLLFGAIAGLVEAGRPVDPVAVAGMLRDRGELDEVGGYTYLMDLAGSIPTTSHAEAYAERVRHESRRRQVITLGRRLVELGEDPEPADHLDQAVAIAVEAAQTEERSDVRSLSDLSGGVLLELEAAREARAKGELPPGRVLFGIPALDARTLGVRRGHLVVIGARPAMGKSSLIMQIGLNIAEGMGTGERLPVLAYSLEMEGEEILTRFACARACVDGRKATAGDLEGYSMDAIRKALDDIKRAPFFVDASSNITLARIRSEARLMKARHGGKLGAILVDYLGLMENEGDDGRKRSAANRQEEVSRISRGLKNIARELDCPVYVASQLNRDLERRSNKRPILADLRDSGAVEQDANLVLFVYRDEVYHPESADRGIAELIIAKHRGGPTGTVRLRYDPEFTWFQSIPQGSSPRPAPTHRPKAAPSAPAALPPAPAESTPPAAAPGSGVLSAEEWDPDLEESA